MDTIFIGPALPGCTRERLFEVVDTLRTLPTMVPWLRTFSVNITLEWCETQAIVLIAEFESRDDWERYMHEPRHVALGDEINDAIDLSRISVVQTDA